jgi:hypothetical protein
MDFSRTILKGEDQLKARHLQTEIHMLSRARM